MSAFCPYQTDEVRIYFVYFCKSLMVMNEINITNEIQDCILISPYYKVSSD